MDSGIDAGLLIMGGFGGCAVYLLSLKEAIELPKDKRPNFKDPLYWISYLIGAGFGVAIVFAYVKSGNNVNHILALHLGATAPLILRTAINTAPKDHKTLDQEA
jgi:hypothetical protein